MRSYKIIYIPNNRNYKTLSAEIFNQDFYNLFLAVGVFLGIYLVKTNTFAAGTTLILFCFACMLAASLVLLVSKPGLLRGVLIQDLCPLIAIACWFFLRNSFSL